MRIGIDARWIFPTPSGVTVYTRELIRALAKHDETNEYILLFESEQRRGEVAAELDLPRDASFTSNVMGYSLFHSTNYMIPLRAFPKGRAGRVKCVVTIHDVIPLLFPGHAPRSRKTRLFPLYRRLMQEIGLRADVIVAVSNTSRGDIIRHLSIPPDRQSAVRTVYNGISDAFRSVQRRETGGADSDRARTVLFVGRADPYKNCVGLVSAFAGACDKADFPLRLVIVGAKDARYPEAEEKINQLGLADKIFWGPMIERDVLKAYRDADLLVLPSFYEGFGLPVAEAMAAGIPVVCSNRGSLPEIAGDAAVFVDPDDSDGLSSAIVRVLENRDMAERLSQNGRAQAAQFTWERTAQQTLAAYETARSM
jgi:glycosyltransferase involved in cell wall biosynthesis